MEKKKEARGRRMSEEKFENEQFKRLATAIEEIIEKENLAQADFCEKAGISLSTLSKIFSPKYARKPSVNTIKKIALASSTPLQAYKKLLGIIGLDISDYPLKAGSFESLVQSQQLVAENLYQLVNKALSKLDKFYRIKTSDIIGDFNLNVFFADGPIKEWFIYFINDFDNDVQNMLSTPGNTQITSFTLCTTSIASIIFDGAKKDKKYSLFYPDYKLVAPLLELNIPTLDTAISILYFEDGELKEQYLNTGISPSVYEEYSI